MICSFKKSYVFHQCRPLFVILRPRTTHSIELFYGSHHNSLIQSTIEQILERFQPSSLLEGPIAEKSSASSCSQVGFSRTSTSRIL